MPKSVTHGEKSVTVSSKLEFVGDVESPLVATIVKRYKDLLFPHADIVEGEIQKVSVVLSDGTSEGYTLTASPEHVEIKAATPAGVQYALETLSQLVAFDFDKALYVTQPVLPLTIEDEPRYQHRGLLIDSSRHFLPVHTIKRLIRSISYAKLNRLHWHVTDAQSFPIHSRVEPLLASKGAWSQRERYTMADVKEIVEYAKEHSIVVVPEFDMPGHTSSWGKAHPELMSLTEDRFNDGNTGALNPTKDETLQLVQSLLKDWLSSSETNSAFFDGPLVHLGTDEVPYQAWSNLGDSNALFNNFVHKITGMAQSLGKEVVLWEEAIKDGSPAQKAIIQIWLDKSMAQRAADNGNRIILSEGWYLDHLDDTWEKMYQRNPASLLSQEKAHLMIGGEGCMWGETVDGGDLEQTVWPRLGAIAEQLWSSDVKGHHEAKPRLESFRCLLLERGIPSGTLEGRGRSTPPGPGSCSTQ
jgi:hexosaminidase